MWGNIELKLQKLFHIVSDPHWIALQGNHETGFNQICLLHFLKNLAIDWVGMGPKGHTQQKVELWPT